MEHPNTIIKQTHPIAGFYDGTSCKYASSLSLPKVIFRANVSDRLAKRLSAGSYPKWVMLRFEFILRLDKLSGVGVLGGNRSFWSVGLGS